MPYFLSFGFPRDVFSDQRLQFMARFWTAFCQLQGATLSLSSGYHPQTDGSDGKDKPRVRDGIPMPFLTGTLILVSDATVFLQYSHNTLPLVSTRVTPFQCVFGYQPSLFTDLEKMVSVTLAVPTDVGSSQTGSPSFF